MSPAAEPIGLPCASEFAYSSASSKIRSISAMLKSSIETGVLAGYDRGNAREVRLIDLRCEGGANADIQCAGVGKKEVSVASLLDVRGWRREAAAQFVIDETTAMAIARDEPEQSHFAFWATGAALFVFWNTGTLIGAIATHAISDPKVFGLDAAPPAAFLALLAPRLRAREPLAIAIAAAAVAIAILPFLPAGVPLLVVALLVSLYGVLKR